MEDALERMRGLIGGALDWTQLAEWLPSEWRTDPKRRRSATASSLAAVLELARSGAVELRQVAAFEPIFLRQRQEGSPE